MKRPADEIDCIVGIESLSEARHIVKERFTPVERTTLDTTIESEGDAATAYLDAARTRAETLSTHV